VKKRERSEEKRRGVREEGKQMRKRREEKVI
jgi:hypothetical protein